MKDFLGVLPGEWSVWRGTLLADGSTLDRLDQEGYEVLEAVKHIGGTVGPSLADPHMFICSDGVTRWCKRHAQQGLLAELVAGRLGAAVGVAPGAAIVNVSPRIGARARHLVGLAVGISDEDGEVVESHEYDRLAGMDFDPVSLAGALAFQAWLGVRDAELLVDAETGRVLSLDNADWGEWLHNDVPRPIAYPAEIADRLTDEHTRRAIAKVAAITDDALMKAVAGIPQEAIWHSGRERRLAVVDYLAARRDRLAQP